MWLVSVDGRERERGMVRNQCCETKPGEYNVYSRGAIKLQHKNALELLVLV